MSFQTSELTLTLDKATPRFELCDATGTLLWRETAPLELSETTIQLEHNETRFDAYMTRDKETQELVRDEDGHFVEITPDCIDRLAKPYRERDMPGGWSSIR